MLSQPKNDSGLVKVIQFQKKNSNKNGSIKCGLEIKGLRFEDDGEWRCRMEVKSYSGHNVNVTRKTRVTIGITVGIVDMIKIL